ALARDSGALPGVPPVGPGPEEELRSDRVELRSCSSLHLGERVLVCQRVTVRPRRDHRVEGIGDREDPGFDGDSTSAESRRIAVTVPPLVVEEHIWERVVEPAHLDDEPRPGGRVAADFRYLLGGEPAGLPQHLRPNLDLAHVMQWGGPAKCANAVA